MAKLRAIWVAGLMALFVCAIPPTASARTTNGQRTFTSTQVRVFNDDVIQGYKDLFDAGPTRQQLRTWVSLGEQFCVALDHGKNGKALISDGLHSVAKRYKILRNQIRSYPVLYSGSMVEAVYDLCPANKSKFGKQMGVRSP